MFDGRSNNVVPSRQQPFEAQVDGLCGVAGEDHPLDLGNAEEFGDPLAGFGNDLVGLTG
jgi:hypothetical protein